MQEEKLILFGCDDPENLAIVMNSLKGSVFFNHNIVTTSRIPELASISKSITADLVISCFRNNQAVLSEFNSFVKRPEIPLLCLTKKNETERLRWSTNSIVFTYPLEHAGNAEHLNSRINSIFLLSSGAEKKYRQNSFADAAIQQGQSNNTRNMSRIILELDQKVDILMKVKDRITNLFPKVDDPVRTELTYIANSIKSSVNNNNLWEDFKLYFVKTNPDFLFKLAQKYPALTQNDLKYCCYLKMNMSNDDIRNLLGINQESVRTHKYRLKKKLELSKDQSLRSYLQSVN